MSSNTAFYSPGLHVNLLVNSLIASRPFYRALGFSEDYELSFGIQIAFRVSYQVRVVLDQVPHPLPLLPARYSLTLVVDSIADVNRLMLAALSAGGIENIANATFDPVTGAFSRGIQDLDSHLWVIRCLGTRLNVFKKMDEINGETVRQQNFKQEYIKMEEAE